MEVTVVPTSSDTSSSSPTLEKNFNGFRKRFQDPATQHLPRIVLDESGAICDFTLPARRLLEYRANEPLNTSFFSLVHGKNLYQVMRDVADMVCYGREEASWLLRLRTGQGRWRWYRAHVHNKLDGPEGALCISLRDLD